MSEAYPLFRKFLFCLPEEQAHAFTLFSLKIAYQLGLTRFLPKIMDQPITCMGLNFKNRIGIAAGLDKNGEYIDALASLGFGFIEIGTVTPKPQAGNPQPRLFRLIKQEALINRLGFNNKGVDYMVKQCAKMHYRGILGINIGKNVDTPLDKATDDYVNAFRALAPFASYITLNISSPNTKDLRHLQQSAYLQPLLIALKTEQHLFNEKKRRYVPLVLKISPDLKKNQLEELAQIALAQKIDGIIATNTTLDRENLNGVKYAEEPGGLSGRPLQARAIDTLQSLVHLCQGKLTLIASGGIMSQSDIDDRLAAGASLVEVYTGLIYHGLRI